LLLGKDKIREIVERSDILEVIGRHVELKRAGRSYRGLCPFHGEKTPSFYVSPERHTYKCFGCQRGGDVIRFLMEIEGKDFMSAVRALATQAGIPLEFDPEEEARLRERRSLLWACEEAEKFFVELLWSPRGAPGRAHLEGRGISEATAREAGLGYAPLAWHELRERLAARNVPVEAALTAGLLARAADDKGGRPYDVFRGRLTIPIRDPDGRVIAFGARVVEGDDDRKYINSRETPLYTKAKVLYGLDTARDAIRRAGEATLVEGYFDAIALREAGIRTVVALCSTALTAEHLALLARLEVRRVNLLLDGDAAGRKGAVRLAGPLLAAGLSTRVVELPDGHDPDTFLREHGREGFDRLKEEAAPLSAFVVAQALAGKGDGYEERLAALRELAPVVSAIPAGAARSLFLGEIAKTIGLRDGDVERFYQGHQPAERPETARPAAGPHSARPGATGPGASPVAAGPGPRNAPARPAMVPAVPLRNEPPPSKLELGLAAILLAYPPLRSVLAGPAAARLVHAGLRFVAARLGDPAAGDEVLDEVDPALRRVLVARATALSGREPEGMQREAEDGLLALEEAGIRDDLAAVLADRDAAALDLARAADERSRGEIEAYLAECAGRVAALRQRREEIRAKRRGEA
jgi:DNA primase